MRAIFNVSASSAAALGLLFSTVPTSTARADDALVCMTKAVAKVAAEVKVITDRSAFGYDDGISLLGGYVAPGSQCSLTRQLQKGVTYAFVAAGDDDARAVNIIVRRAGTDAVVAKDVRRGVTPIVIYTPSRSGSYQIDLRLRRARAASFCSLGIMRRDGWTVPVSNMSSALASCLTTTAKLAQDGHATSFLHVKNQWSLFGAVINEGDSQTLRGIRMNDGKHVFSAGADSHAEEVGLALLDHRGEVVEEDSDSDAVKMFEAETSTDHSYSVRIVNTKSDSPSLIVGVVLNR